MAPLIQLRDDFPMPPGEPLGIQMLDAERVLHLTGTQNLSDATVQIIEQLKPRENDTFRLMAEGNLLDYSVKVYWLLKPRISYPAEEPTLPTDAANVATTSDAIFFYYKETPQRCIFALTFGILGEMVQPYARRFFPTQLAKTFADPDHIKHLSQRDFFESKTRIVLFKPRAHTLLKTSNLVYLVDTFIGSLKRDSSLSRLIEERIMKEEDSRSMPVITIIHGLIIFDKQLRLSDYPAMLNLFVQFVRGNPTLDLERNGVLIREIEDPRFAFLNFLQPVGICRWLWSRLNSLLIKDIYSRWIGQPTGRRRGQLVDIRRGRRKAFPLPTNFEIEISDMPGFEGIGSNRPSLETVLQRISTPGTDEVEFRSNLRLSRLGCRYQNDLLGADAIIDLIEGPLCDSGETYFKIKGEWYLLEENYISQLREAFKTLIRNNSRISSLGCRIGNLSISEFHWRNTNYLVLDKVILDDIKLCDLLKYTSYGDTQTVYLYHVAGELVQNTGDAATHLLNSATMIRSVLASNFQLPNDLQRIWNLGTEVSNDNMRQELKSRLESLGTVENFYELFRGRIVFVYTHLFEPDNHDFNFTLLRGNSNTTTDEVIRQRLTRFRYLKEADLTRMRAMSLPACRFHAAGRMMDAINLRNYRITSQSDRCFESLLPQLELLHLAHNLRDLNFELEFRVS